MLLHPNNPQLYLGIDLAWLTLMVLHVRPCYCNVVGLTHNHKSTNWKKKYWIWVFWFVEYINKLKTQKLPKRSHFSFAAAGRNISQSPIWK